MNPEDWIQLVIAVFTAAAAAAALRTVKHAAAQTQTAREALAAQTAPLLADVPRGQERRPTSFSHEGEPSGWRDVGEVSVGHGGVPTGEDEFRMWAATSVPVRNIGNGAARIDAVTIVCSDAKASGFVESPLLGTGELTRVGIQAEEKDADFGLAEEIGGAYQNFSVTIEYSDAAGKPRGVLVLEVTNGQHPRVTGRQSKLVGTSAD